MFICFNRKNFITNRIIESTKNFESILFFFIKSFYLFSSSFYLMLKFSFEKFVKSSKNNINLKRNNSFPIYSF